MNEVRDWLSAVHKRMAETQSGLLTTDEVSYLNQHLNMAAGGTPLDDSYWAHEAECKQPDILTDFCYLWQGMADIHKRRAASAEALLQVLLDGVDEYWGTIGEGAAILERVKATLGTMDNGH